MRMMTGRDLIIYIIQNGLENEPVYEDGKILGFMNELEAAVKFNVSTSTIRVWIGLKMLDGVLIGNVWYIPANTKSPMEIDTAQNGVNNV